MSITVDTMRPKLHTLDHIHTVLGRTEPLSSYAFTVGDTVNFTVDSGWLHGLETKAGSDPVDVSIHIGADEVRLSKDVVIEAATTCGLRQGFTVCCPPDLLERHLNYWFRQGLANKGGAKDFQLLVAGGLGSAITRATVHPFSNLRLLEQAVAGIQARYGQDVDILADYKLVHSLNRTHLRLIIPEQQRTIERTGTDDDTWSVGIQLRNSLTGQDKTSLDGYLFRWTCTNGAVDTRATSGVWSRRGNATADVYEWARAAVDDILGGLEPALDAVQATVDIPIHGEAHDVLRDIFEHYRVPVAERTKIIEALLNTGASLTMYTVMQAITQTANDSDLDPTHVENLMRLGGDLPHAAASRCDSCRRLMPH